MNKNNSGNEEKILFPEHDFISTCLRLGLTLGDLKLLTYIDVIKIMLSFLRRNKEKPDTRQATQQDINRFLK